MTELMEKWPEVSVINSKIKNKNCVLVINHFTNHRDKITDITVAYKTRRKNEYEIRPQEKSMYVFINPIPITAQMLGDQNVMWSTIVEKLPEGHKKVLEENELAHIGDYLEAMYKNNLIRKFYPDTDEY